MARKKLGEVFIERGIIDEDQLNSALAYQRQWGHRLGVALVAKGFVTEGMLAKVLGEVMSLPTIDLSKGKVDPEAMRMIPYNTCENNDLIPVSLEQKGKSRVLTVAMADPMNVAIIDEIEFTTGCKVRPVLAMISAINSAIRKFYRGQNTVIKPLVLYRDQMEDTEHMELVRPGGEVEKVDTQTYADTGKIMNLTDEVDQADGQAAIDKQVNDAEMQSEVAKIKARRAKRLTDKGQKRISSEEAMQDYLKEVQTSELEALHKMEKYFWALMRVVAKKGLVTKEEFLQELKE
jgi:type II secretion system (T2SS) protein E